MNKSWIFYVCNRFSRIDRKGRSKATSTLATLGITLGVMTLIVIMSVMNGFQMSFIDTILEVSSYHLQADQITIEQEKDFFEIVQNDNYLSKKIIGAFPFYEAQTLLTSNKGKESAAIIRAVDYQIYNIDKGFQDEVVVTRGVFNISQDNYIVLGSSLARELGVGVGEEIDLFVLSGGNDVSLFSNDRKFIVTGIFTSGYAEVNSSFCFVNLDVAKKYFGEKSKRKLGVKLYSSEEDLKILSKLQNVKEFSDIKFQTWRDYNKSFYSTLKIEKNMLLLLIALIFVVVAINIFNSMRRLVYERQNEIAIFSSLGATKKQVQMIFVFRGLISGLIGGIIGLILGLIISYNSDVVFNLVAKIMFMFEYLYTLITNPSFAAYVTENSIYSLYASIPARVFYDEVIMIALFGIFCPLIACYFASKNVLKMKIVEVLHE